MGNPYPNDPPPQAGPEFTQADIDNAIQQGVERALQMQAEAHADEMEALRATFVPVQATPVPAHSGGPGTKIQPTWSLADQTLAVRGEHPLQQSQR